jgi:DNA mismatch repair protein MutL
MSRKVHVLSDDVVNRIAAGEVVERPASVVKELVENAIDARATEISVLVDKGGLREIRVLDNGVGMGREDALTAFQRYATSKIRMSEDLVRIETLGFRGEALPSIASMAKVKIVTREAHSLTGTGIWLEGGQVKQVRDTGCPSGTDLTVEDLFFNTPARRKFQRSVGTEFSHIVDVVTRIALAYCDVHFRLYHNEKRVLDIPGTKDRLVRIGSLLGKETYKTLHRVHVRMDSIEIEAYLSEPVFTRPNPKGIYIYVNGRFVRDRIIHHAIMAGYRNLIPRDRYPVAVLFLKLPSWSVDSNVHPTKTEVRFSSTDLIHRSVGSLAHALKGGVTGNNLSVSEDHGKSGVPHLTVEDSSARYGSFRTPADEENPHVLKPLQGDLHGQFQSLPRVLGQIGKTYLVCESRRGLVLIDQHAAHERILFQRLKRDLEHGKPEAQSLLFPETIDLSPLEFETAERHLPELRRLGFDLEPFGRNTIVIKAVPSILYRKDCFQVVLDLIRDLVGDKGPGGMGKGIEMVLKVTACHGAIRSGQALTREEIVMLLKGLEQEGFTQTCPHGRPACVEIGAAELEKMFMRSS